MNGTHCDRLSGSIMPRVGYIPPSLPQGNSFHMSGCCSSVRYASEAELAARRAIRQVAPSLEDETDHETDVPLGVACAARARELVWRRCAGVP